LRGPEKLLLKLSLSCLIMGLSAMQSMGVNNQIYVDLGEISSELNGKIIMTWGYIFRAEENYLELSDGSSKLRVYTEKKGRIGDLVIASGRVKCWEKRCYLIPRYEGEVQIRNREPKKVSGIENREVGELVLLEAKLISEKDYGSFSVLRIKTKEEEIKVFSPKRLELTKGRIYSFSGLIVIYKGEPEIVLREVRELG